MGMGSTCHTKILHKQILSENKQNFYTFFLASPVSSDSRTMLRSSPVGFG